MFPVNCVGMVLGSYSFGPIYLEDPIGYPAQPGLTRPPVRPSTRPPVRPSARPPVRPDLRPPAVEANLGG